MSYINTQIFKAPGQVEGKIIYSFKHLNKHSSHLLSITFLPFLVSLGTCFSVLDYVRTRQRSLRLGFESITPVNNVLFTPSLAACSGSAGVFAIPALPSTYCLRLDWQPTAFRTVRLTYHT